MTGMNDSPSDRPGLLVLLGGEGLRNEADSLWHLVENLSPGALSNVACLSAALANHKVETRDRQFRLISEHLASYGGSARLAPISNHENDMSEDQNGLLEDASSYCFVGGEPMVLAGLMIGSPAWRTIRQRNAEGTPIIASGAAAAAFGEFGIAPKRPFPARLPDLTFESFPGLRLLPTTVVLPYLSWLPDSLISEMLGICPADVHILGIDHPAALVWDGSAWQAEGLGSVTRLGANGTRQTVDAGQMIPADWIPRHGKAA